MYGKVEYTGDTSLTNMPSKIIWHDCPVEEYLFGGLGKYVWDDFVGPGPGEMYKTYADTGVTFLGMPAFSGGAVEIGGNDADNDEGVISGVSPAFIISDTAGDDKDLWFETRIRKESVANNALGMFVGLGWDFGDGVSVAKTLCLTDDDAALGAFSFIGFHVDQADGDALDFVYKAEGQSAVVLIAGVQALAANTWYKLGFRYKPKEDAAKRIKIYVDGVEQTTYVTATNIATATFPDAEGMAPVLAAKVGTDTAEVQSQMDWWRVAQAY